MPSRGTSTSRWPAVASSAAWVDLREGSASERRSRRAGTGPGDLRARAGWPTRFQTLEPGTVYSYLVNEHWSAEAKSDYSFVNLADETLGVDWPIPLTEAEMSQADRDHPRLAEVRPMAAKKILIIGGGRPGRPGLGRVAAGCRWLLIGP